MIEHVYCCNSCLRLFSFKEHEESENIVCPICTRKMRYSNSEDISDETGLVTKRWVDEERKKLYPEIKNVKPAKPTITCPYCQSTDCKKISGLSKVGSVAVFGIFGLGKASKQWHCNRCNSDF